MKLKFGELFSGPGGIGYAALNSNVRTKTEEFSFSHAWATDYDRDTCQTYSQNVVGKKQTKSVVCSDIRDLNVHRLKNVSPIDMLAFGFPCNDFSVVGEQKGINGAYGPLYKYAVRVLRAFKPDFFLAENVSGLRNSNDGQAFKEILNELAGLGYNLVPHLYKFEEYGVPQARHRIIIIGVKNSCSVTFRVPSTSPYRKLDVTARNAIENPEIAADAFNHELTNHAKHVVERLGFIKPGQNAFNATLPRRLRLNVKGVKISQIYKRLDPNKPAYTVTGSGGGGTHVYHWSEPRALTNRERARLQTFPDSFQFCGAKESVRKQIGMAVPPRGAKVILEALLKSIAGVDYEHIDNNIKTEVGV